MTVFETTGRVWLGGREVAGVFVELRAFGRSVRPLADRIVDVRSAQGRRVPAMEA